MSDIHKQLQQDTTVKTKTDPMSEVVEVKEKPSTPLSSDKERTATHATVARENEDIAAEKAKLAANEAGDAAKSAAIAAKERTEQAALSAKDYISSTAEDVIHFVKEHLPKVEHEEPTPEEQQANALMDEAMALAQGTEVPIRQSAAAEAPAFRNEQVPEGIGPDAATEVINKSSEALERAKDKAADVIEQTPGKVRDYTSPDLGGAPDELNADSSAKGPLETLTEKAKHAGEYVR